MIVFITDNINCTYCSEDFGDGQVVLASNDLGRVYHHYLGGAFSTNMTCFRKQQFEDNPTLAGLPVVYYQGKLYSIELLNDVAETTELEMAVDNNGSSFILEELSKLSQHSPLKA